jgi:O-acetyl-ADP-ribose deacetylase (regulator of RNase III)
MIHYTQGNLLEANVEALVNTVNTVGVMGKGVDADPKLISL